MKVIKEHIKANSFKQFYLLYGSEEYLKKLYRINLKMRFSVMAVI